MVKRILALYLISFFIFPPIAFADEAEEAPVSYEIVTLKKGDPAPFDGIFLSPQAAAKVLTEKKFEDAECDLRVEYELQIQRAQFQLQLDFKDVEIHSWKDKYESMMILKSDEITRLQEFAMQPKPASGPLFVALGFAIGTATSLGVFAISMEIVR
ncbi:hypothetical protein CL634_11235 [bacterium]|nr:hypothetical protein [bacterium]